MCIAEVIVQMDYIENLLKMSHPITWISMRGVILCGDCG